MYFINQLTDLSLIITSPFPILVPAKEFESTVDIDILADKATSGDADTSVL